MDNYIEIQLDSIRFGIAASVRSGVDPKTVDRYAGLWRDYREELDEHAAQPNKEPPEYPFPPIRVAAIESDGKSLYDCVSGQHRAQGAVRAGMSTIRCEIVTGTPADLLKIAIKENKVHGKAFTPADLKCCVLAAREAFPELGCRPLAQMIGCSKSQVGRILTKLKNPDKCRPKAKPKQKATLTEAIEDDLEMTNPQFCDYALDTIRNEADLQDAETVKSLGNLVIGIVNHLEKHGSVKSLQRRLAAINTSK